MSVRRIFNKARGQPAGQLTLDDIDLITNYHKGVDLEAIDPANASVVNTSTRFRDNKARVGESDTAYSRLATLATAVRTHSFPDFSGTLLSSGGNNDLGDAYVDLGDIAVPGDPGAGVVRLFFNSATGKFSVKHSNGTIVSLEEQNTWNPSSTETISNKTFTSSTMNAADNTMPGLQTTPDVGLVGGWLPGGGSVSGVTFGYVAAAAVVAPGAGTQTVGTSTNSVEGKFQKFTTGAAIDNNAGNRTTTGASVIRGRNGRYKFRWRMTGTTIAERAYFGLVGNTAAALAGDDPMATTQGIVFGYRTTDTNYGIIHSSGSATTYTATTNATVAKTDTGIHTVEIKADDSASPANFRVSVDGTAFQTITTPIPAQTTVLVPHQYIFTTANAAREFDMFYWFVEQD